MAGYRYRSPTRMMMEDRYSKYAGRGYDMESERKVGYERGRPKSPERSRIAKTRPRDELGRFLPDSIRGSRSRSESPVRRRYSRSRSRSPRGYPRKVDLIEMARERGVKYSGLNKEELMEALGM